MKILLTGILPASAPLMAQRLMKDGLQTAILGRLPESAMADAAGVTVHQMNPDRADALRMLEAGGYDAVVFFYAFQCEDKREYGSVQGTMLDTLFSMQHAAQRSGATAFVLVTDRRVFGANQACAEDEAPLPDTPTGMLIKAAEDCLTCADHGDMRILILRVTSLYAPGSADGFFEMARARAEERAPMILHGTRKTPCDFLHTDDVALFLGTALENELSGVYHLAYGAPRTYGDLEDAFRKYYPDLTVDYTGRGGAAHTLRVSSAQRAEWVPRHDCLSEMDELTRNTLKKGKKPLRITFIHFRWRVNRRLLPWIELILLGAAAWAMTRLSVDNAAFRHVDYWMLFTVLIGYMHGSMMGAVAALTACAAFTSSWLQDNSDISLLLYNFDNWIPLVTYVLAGSSFGYISDRHHAKITQMERERKATAEEKDLLQSMYQQTSEDRNLLQEQVLNYRDSYGRIYQITRKLDTMQPEQIFLSTLEVLEDVMQNHSVALYSCQPGNAFARLVLHSRAYMNVDRSLNLNNLPDVRAALEKGKLFVNTGLEANCPAFASPIMDQNGLTAIIMLWEVSFEQQTQYHQNLMSVITGLVQSAMVRAIRFISTSGDMYLPDTHILSSDAFRATLQIYQKMRKQRTASYLLVHLESDAPLSAADMDARIGKATRATDVSGYLDGHGYYVLFPQAGTENLPLISSRFRVQGLQCTVIGQEVAYV